MSARYWAVFRPRRQRMDRRRLGQIVSRGILLGLALGPATRAHAQDQKPESPRTALDAKSFAEPRLDPSTPGAEPTRDDTDAGGTGESEPRHICGEARLTLAQI